MPIKATQRTLGFATLPEAGKTCSITFSVKWDENSTIATKDLTFSAELEYEQSTDAFTGTPAHTDA